MRNTSQKTKSAKSIRGSEAYSKPCQSSKNELFAKIINSFQPFTIFEKTSILDIQQGFEYIWGSILRQLEAKNFTYST